MVQGLGNRVQGLGPVEESSVAGHEFGVLGSAFIGLLFRNLNQVAIIRKPYYSLPTHIVVT